MYRELGVSRNKGRIFAPVPLDRVIPVNTLYSYGSECAFIPVFVLLGSTSPVKVRPDSQKTFAKAARHSHLSDKHTGPQVGDD